LRRCGRRFTCCASSVQEDSPCCPAYRCC